MSRSDEAYAGGYWNGGGAPRDVYSNQSNRRQTLPEVAARILKGFPNITTDDLIQTLRRSGFGYVGEAEIRRYVEAEREKVAIRLLGAELGAEPI